MALTDKRQIFVREYLRTWNASEAARIAGYAHPGSDGHRLLKISEIAEEIQRYVADRGMSADEVLIRLAEMARGSMTDFLTVKEGIKRPYIDFEKARDAGAIGLVKKFKYGKDGEIEFELYDAQAALVQLGKVHKLFTEKTEVSGPNGADIPVKTTHVIDANTAENIFGILAAIGAVEPAPSNAKDDEVHTADAN